MFTLLLILLIVGFSLGAGLFVGGLFVQGYIYTEPSPHLRWSAPATAAALFLFLTFWCLIVVFSGATRSDIPYDALHRFSPEVDRFSAPVKDLWAVRKGGKQEHYVLKKHVVFAGRANSEYRSAETDRPWNNDGVEAIVVKQEDGPDMRFERVPDKQREQGAYNRFVTPDGWIMTVFETGPTGLPSRFRFGRFFVNLLLNFLHLAIWFVCLWLLMRFQWDHALLGAFLLWVACTLIIVPMLLDYAAQVSQARQSPAATAALMADRIRPG